MGKFKNVWLILSLAASLLGVYGLINGHMNNNIGDMLLGGFLLTSVSLSMVLEKLNDILLAISRVERSSMESKK
ncbi:hypothetical protein N9043_00600 [bacterium]|nr:hypothetical protein [bacterium]